MNNFQTIKVIVLLYIIITFTEWYIHKNIMHKSNGLISKYLQKIHVDIYKYSPSDKHENHHKLVENDGSVYDGDGLLFLKMDSILSILIIFILYFFMSKILIRGLTKNHYITIFITVTIIAILYHILWNTLHPRYHRFNNYYNENGIIENSFIYKYLEKYHMIHHLNKGDKKCNFNIILPGADFIMGTYRGCVDNTKLCNSSNKLTMKEIDLCSKQKVGEKLPYGINYCPSPSSSSSSSSSSSPSSSSSSSSTPSHSSS